MSDTIAHHQSNAPLRGNNGSISNAMKCTSSIICAIESQMKVTLEGEFNSLFHNALARSGNFNLVLFDRRV